MSHNAIPKPTSSRYFSKELEDREEGSLRIAPVFCLQQLWMAVPLFIKSAGGAGTRSTGLGDIEMQRVNRYLENTGLETEGPLQAWVRCVCVCGGVFTGGTVKESALESECGPVVGARTRAHTHTTDQIQPTIWFVDDFIET